MNKIFNEFITKYNMEEFNESCKGVINGYQVELNYTASTTFFTVFIATNFSDYNKRIEVQNYLTSNKKKFKFTKAQIMQSGVLFQFIVVWSAKKSLQQVEPVILEITEAFGSMGLLASDKHCPKCGKEFDSVNKMLVNGLHVDLCSECSKNIEVAVQKDNEEFEALPNNYAKGALGALIGAAIGGIVWIVVAFLGFVSALVGVLTAFLSAKGYDKAKGKPTKVKLFIVAGISIAMCILATYLVYVLVAQSVMLEVESNPNAYSAFEYFNILMETLPEFKEGFTSDLVASIIYGALGVFLQVWSQRKKVR